MAANQSSKEQEQQAHKNKQQASRQPGEAAYDKKLDGPNRPSV
ncbi:hypothetical protein [Paenibacillus piri]|nr:hypothetical protein [Paenibacillus piri]